MRKGVIRPRQFGSAPARDREDNKAAKFEQTRSAARQKKAVLAFLGLVVLYLVYVLFSSAPDVDGTGLTADAGGAASAGRLRATAGGLDDDDDDQDEDGAAAGRGAAEEDEDEDDDDDDDDEGEGDDNHREGKGGDAAGGEGGSASGSMAGAGFEAELSGLFPEHGALQDTVRAWMAADAPNFDVGGFVVGDDVKEAHLLGKSPGVMAGRPFAQAVFDVAGVEVEWLVADGHVISDEDAKAKKPVAIVRGPVRKILIAERTALNVMSRASGIATAAREMAKIKAAHNWHGEVAATRKTTPGFAIVEKYAVLVGGCSTHRMTLSQMVMLKDNHVWSVGSIPDAVKKARRAAGFSSKIEVECRDLDEAIQAATAGAEVVMLDNYEPEDLKVDAAKLKEQFPHVLIEASGGITETTAPGYFSPHVDVLSMGKLTQGYGALDFSLKIQR